MSFANPREALKQWLETTSFYKLFVALRIMQDDYYIFYNVLQRVADFFPRKIIQVPIPSLMTIIRNAPKSFELETSSHVASARWLPFARRCVRCMLTKVHFSCAVDEIISVSHRTGTEREMRSQCKHLSGTPKRANTGAECPEVANSLAYTRVPSIRTIRCSVSFSLLCIFSRRQVSSLAISFASLPTAETF